MGPKRICLPLQMSEYLNYGTQIIYALVTSLPHTVSTFDFQFHFMMTMIKRFPLLEWNELLTLNFDLEQ